MQLSRAAYVVFERFQADWTVAKFEIGDISVAVFKGKYKEKFPVYVQATKKLEYKPKVTKEGAVVVNNKIRRQLEICIEKVADLLTLVTPSPRKIVSPMPCIFFHFENDNERKWLEEKKSVLYKRADKTHGIPVSTLSSLDVTNYLPELADRLDGVEIIAEAHNHTHMCGKFNQYFRLFERAFRVGNEKLVPLLQMFFKSLRYCYTPEEIQNWMNIRNEIVHGKGSFKRIGESYVTPYIQRIEQAAYDILMNKSLWNQSDTSRRKLWYPEVCSGKNCLHVKVGNRDYSKFNVLDEHGVFPLDFNLLKPLNFDTAWHKYSLEDDPSTGAKFASQSLSFFEDFYDVQ